MNLVQIREQIDFIDNEILRLIKKRFEYSETLAKVKFNEGLKIYDEVRERKILDKVKINSGEFEKYVLPVFVEILASSKLIQQDLHNDMKKN